MVDGSTLELAINMIYALNVGHLHIQNHPHHPRLQ